MQWTRVGPLMTMGPGFCFHPSDPAETDRKDARMTSSVKDCAGGQAPIHLLELEASPEVGPWEARLSATVLESVVW